MARLSLGFWTGLLDRRFSYLWRVIQPVFIHVPPTTRVTADGMERLLGDIRDLRNAIAHHDPIIDWYFERSIRGMDNLVGPVSPPILKWMKERSRVDAVLAEDPRRTIRR